MKKKIIVRAIALCLAMLMLASLGSVFAADPIHVTSIAESKTLLGYTYTAYSGLTAYDTGVIRGEGTVSASSTIPVGYMGVRPRVFSQSEALVATSGFYYNTNTSGASIMNTCSATVASEFYFSRALFCGFNGNGYTPWDCKRTVNVLGGPNSSARTARMEAITIAEIVAEMEKSKSPNYYPVNASGQTYGSALYAYSYEYEPDLIAAVGTNGREGYILRSDEQAAVDLTLEEVLSGAGNEDVAIPLYESDGKTVIGEFIIRAAQPAGN